MTALLAVLLFAQAGDLAEARRAALDKYETMLRDAEKRHLEQEIRNAKAGRMNVQIIKIAENNLELWKSGAYRPPESAYLLPYLPNPDTIKVGDVGRLMPFSIASIVDEHMAVIRTKKSQQFGSALNTTPFILNRRTNDFPGTDVEIPKTPFWVSGKKTLGKQTLFIIEPLGVSP